MTFTSSLSKNTVNSRICLKSEIGEAIEKNSEIFADIMEKKDYSIEYPKNLVDNYLKIISNIYYLNTRKIYKEICSDQLKYNQFYMNSPNNRYVITERLYQRFLNETRNEVLDFFKVEDAGEISRKYITRCYVQELDLLDKAYLQYKSLNTKLNNLTLAITDQKKFSCLLLDNHPMAITGPVDVI